MHLSYQREKQKGKKIRQMVAAAGGAIFVFCFLVVHATITGLRVRTGRISDGASVSGVSGMTGMTGVACVPGVSSVPGVTGVLSGVRRSSATVASGRATMGRRVSALRWWVPAIRSRTPAGTPGHRSG